MDKDNLEVLIFRKVLSDIDIPKLKEFQLVAKSKTGKLQIVEKLPKNWSENGDNYFVVNTNKRWYRILWGTRDRSISTKAHGEMTIAMINPLRLLHNILPDGSFLVRDLQIYMSERLTEYIKQSQQVKLVSDKILKELNGELESLGVELTTLDIYKGAY
jgi:hypothetical protein